MLKIYIIFINIFKLKFVRKEALLLKLNSLKEIQYKPFAKNFHFQTDFINFYLSIEIVMILWLKILIVCCWVMIHSFQWDWVDILNTADKTEFEPKDNRFWLSKAGNVMLKECWKYQFYIKKKISETNLEIKLISSKLFLFG